MITADRCIFRLSEPNDADIGRRLLTAGSNSRVRDTVAGSGRQLPGRDIPYRKHSTKLSTLSPLLYRFDMDESR